METYKWWDASDGKRITQSTMTHCLQFKGKDGKSFPNTLLIIDTNCSECAEVLLSLNEISEYAFANKENKHSKRCLLKYVNPARLRSNVTTKY